ncbi:hypothetical protein ACFQZQ_06320 [Lysobacter koreensis]|uniref:DUF1269 domain-containing protein n=1 Tax=Lysobacter koreensis TaxID=266122 RepID=A0ABW2YKK1_9GAMM
MKTRHVFSTPDLETAQAAMAAARQAGIDDECLLLVARSDIELDSIPDGRKEADSDFIPAALRGAGYGGATGLLVGLVAVVLTPIGLTVAGVGAVAAAGALVGCWASALVGSSLPDPVRRKFHDEIEAGRILLVIDATKEVLDDAEAAIARTGATPLPYEATTALIR